MNNNLATDLQAQNIIDDAFAAIMSANDSTDLRKSCFDDLSGLFGAISQLASDHSAIKNLANIGSYLTQDWGHMCECASSDLTEKLEVLRKLKR